MEKLTKYLVLSIGMSAGAYAPALFGAGSLSGWSFLGSFIGGIAAIVFMVKMEL